MNRRTRLASVLALAVLSLSFVGWQGWQTYCDLQRPPGKPGAPPLRPGEVDRTPPRWDEMAGADRPGAVRFEGIWYDTPDKPSGALFAVVYLDDAGQCRATFAGYWGHFFKFPVSNPGGRVSEGVRFDGITVMHSEDDLWHWQGTLEPDKFDGTFKEQSSGRVGGFRLKPMADQPVTALIAATPAGVPAAAPQPADESDAGATLPPLTPVAPIEAPAAPSP
jgi:hypothetical protein